MGTDAAERYTEYMPIDDLISADRNSKGHDDDAIRASYERFGYVEQILIDERTGKLLGGHGRVDNLRALRASGAEPPEGVTADWKAPVSRGYATKNDEEAEALGIALNRTSQLGGWIDEILAESLESISDLRGVGFGADDVDDLLARLEQVAYTPPEEFTGGYAEASSSSIVSREAGEEPSAEAAPTGTRLREIVLLYKPEDHAELISQLRSLGKAWDLSSLASIVKRCVLEAQA